MPARAASTWPASSGSGTTSAPGFGGQLLGDRVAADDDQALDRARFADRFQHVGDHRPGQFAAAFGLDAGGQPLLGGVEALDG